MSTPLRQLAGLAGAVAASFAFTTAAHATTLDFLGFKNGSVTSTILAPISVGTEAGELLFREVSTDTIFSTFCIEIGQTIQDPDYNYTAMAIASDAGVTAGQRNNLQKLFNAYYETLGSSATNSAAFQLAVWEIMNEASPADVTTGTFRVSSSSGATTQANYWLQSLASLPMNANGGWELTTWRSKTSQDQISASRVPEPASAALLLLGLGMMGAARRRNRAA